MATSTPGKDTGKEPALEVADVSAKTDAESVQESPRATKRVKTVWPTGSFEVENVPVVYLEGTMLTATQLKAVEKAAEQCGVSLEIEEAD